MGNARSKGSGLVLVLAAILLATPALGAGDVYRLAKGVPQDAFLYVGWAKNPERAYLERYHEAVWEEFRASGIVEDVKGLLLGMVPDAGRKGVEASLKQGADLLSSVPWRALFEKNGAYAMTWGSMVPYHLWIVEVDPAKTGKLSEGFARILKTLAGLTPEISYTVSGEDGGPTIHSLTFPPQVPYGIHVAVMKDRIVCSTGRTLLDRSLALLRGDASTGTMLSNQSFLTARQALPGAEDAFSFFDVASMLEGIRGLLQTATKGKMDEDASQGIEMVKGILDDANFVQYVASAQFTEGYRNLQTSYTQFRPGVQDKPIWKIFGNQRPFQNFQRYVPKEATSFSLSGGVDLGAAYQYALGILAKAPGSKEILDRWDAIQKNVLKLDVYKEVLSRIAGETVTVSFPASNPTPMASNSSVTMIRVREPEKLAPLVEGWLKNLANLAGKNGFPLTIQPVEVLEGGRFQAIQLAMLPFLRPVLGFHGDQLVFGSDAAAIRKVLTLPGDPQKTILGNPRFRAVGLVPPGEVSAIRYRNLEEAYRNMAKGLQSAGMIMGMMSGMMAAQMPKDAPKGEIMALVNKVTSIIPKLAPVVAKIDFYQDSVTYSYFDREKGAAVTRTATSIRPPKKKEGEQGSPEEGR